MFRLVVKVPVNLTRFEIRNYVQQIYGAKVMYCNTLIRIPSITQVKTGRWKNKYYRNGPIHKRAFLITEYRIPDEIRMMRSSKTLIRNPDLLKNNVNWGVWPNARLRKKDLPEKSGAWRHPIPKLLAPKDMELNPKLHIDDNETMMAPKLSKPFLHAMSPFAPKKGKPEGVPSQKFQPVDLYPWRKRFAQLRDSGVLLPQGASAGIGDGLPTHPMAQLLHGNKKPKPIESIAVASGKLKPTPSPWRAP